MKYYVIKLPHVNGEHQYPSDYEQTIGVFNQGHVYYDDKADDLFTLLISIPDKNALAILPQNVSEVTEAEAFAIANQYDPKTQIIVNEATVRLLEIKSRLGMPLSSDELKGLDPAENVGFGVSENFVDKIKEKKVLEEEK